MNKRTRKALEASIKHWKENRQAETPHQVSAYSDSCPLCELFIYSRPPEDPCTGCPVMEKTGHRLCVHSPWKAASRALEAWRLLSTWRRAFRAACTREIKFLKSLREDDNA